MIFLDTNVLIDVLGLKDPPQDSWSLLMIEKLAREERFATNLIVAAELASELPASEQIAASLTSADVELIDLSLDTAIRASFAYREYRRRGGARTTILPDFLIAAHAATLGATLMTRDRRLGSYFPDLTLITPETHP